MTLEFTPAGFDAFQTNITEVSTVRIGTASSTGTANQPLQVGTATTQLGAYISGNLGIGTTTPTSKLQVVGNVLISGIATVNNNFVVNTNTFFVDSVNNRVGINTLVPTQPFQIGSGSSVVIIDSIGELGIGTTNPLQLLQVGVAGSNTFVATSSGSVGIGTTNPTRRLHIFGNALTNQFNAAISVNTTNTTGFGAYLGVNASSVTSGRDYRLVSAGTSDTAGSGKFSIYDMTANADRLVVTGVGSVGIGTTNPQYTLQVAGSFGAVTKSFDIPHPTKPGMTLRHGSLEGPENGVYVRGKTTESIISLPDYWIGLVHEDSITVNLTPRNGKLHSVISASNQQVEVECVDGEIDCYFMILGERKDVAKLEVER